MKWIYLFKTDLGWEVSKLVYFFFVWLFFIVCEKDRFRLDSDYYFYMRILFSGDRVFGKGCFWNVLMSVGIWGYKWFLSFLGNFILYGECVLVKLFGIRFLKFIRLVFLVEFYFRVVIFVRRVSNVLEEK